MVLSIGLVSAWRISSRSNFLSGRRLLDHASCHGTGAPLQDCPVTKSPALFGGET